MSLCYPFHLLGRSDVIGVRERFRLHRASKGVMFTIVLAALVNSQTMWAGTPEHENKIFSLPFEALGDLLVRSVDFFETSLTRSPTNVSVITSDDIDRLPALTLQDFIQYYVPGAHMAAQGPLGLNFGSRGQSRGGGANVLSLWDGHNMNFRSTGGFRVRYFSHLLGDLEQVEIIVGPGSLVHGSGAIHGTINFVPKTGKDHPGLKSRIELGASDDLLRFDTGYGHEYGENRHFFLYGGFMQAGGYRFNNDFGGFAFNPAGFAEKETVFEYEPSFKLSGTWTHEQFQLTTMFERLEVDPNTLTTNFNLLQQESILTVQPRYTHSFDNGDSIDITPSLTFLDNSLIRTPRRADSPPGNEEGGSESITELRAIYQSERFRGQKIALGGSVLRRDLRSLEQYFSSDANIDNLNAIGDWLEYAVFVEDRISLSPRLTLALGLRGDWTDFSELRFERAGFDTVRFTPDNASNVSPRVVLNYLYGERHAMRLSFQEGFGYPLAETFPRLAQVNQVLEAAGEELFRQLEPGVTKSVEFGYNGRFMDDTLNAQLNLYYFWKPDSAAFRRFDVDPPIVSPEVRDLFPPGVNGLVFDTDFDFSGYGGELSLTWRPNPQFRLFAAYAYATPGSISPEANRVLSVTNDERTEWQFYPTHQIKTNIDYRLQRWSFNVSAIFESGVDRELNAFDDAEFEDDHVRVNAIARYRINKQLSATLLVKNLFKNGTPPVGTNRFPFNGNLGTDKRTFYLGLRWHPE